jgi:hypothetical protein
MVSSVPIAQSIAELTWPCNLHHSSLLFRNSLIQMSDSYADKC